jgi:hypothetical protein
MQDHCLLFLMALWQLTLILFINFTMFHLPFNHTITLIAITVISPHGLFQPEYHESSDFLAASHAAWTI